MLKKLITCKTSSKLIRVVQHYYHNMNKARYQALVGGCEPLQSYLHKRLTENLNSEAALSTVTDVAQCVQWLRSTFLYVRAAKDPRRYLNVPQNAPPHIISKKIEELCVKAMNGLASAGLITMDEASCIESTEAGTLMSIYYLDFETMKIIMKLAGSSSLPELVMSVCESHELADLHLRVEERRTLNALNRNSQSASIRFPMKGKITTRQMKLSCLIQAILGCITIPDPSLNQEAMKIMRIAGRICKCLVSYLTRPNFLSQQPQYYSAILNSVVLAKCVAAQLWENSPLVSKQLKGIGPTYSTALATAGKVNFMVLEESHPRDLERIMNKGPPAGNVIRKQISLLPKYKLSITPVDDMTVTIQLMLMNQSYLSENIDNLTAGDAHKSYVIVGDSENHILLCTSFVDKNLIKVYDGTLTFSVTRKHRFEHKILAHCVSSTYVGIDDQCDYLFKDLDPMPVSTVLEPTVANSAKKIMSKQTSISDKERKRKGNNSIEISQCKEKKRRDNALYEKFKLLKRSFCKTSKSLQEELIQPTLSDWMPADLNDKEYPDLTNSISEDVKAFEEDEELEVLNYSKPNDGIIPRDNQHVDSIINEYSDIDTEDYKYMDNGNIDSILTEIENEISKKPADGPYLPEIHLNKNKEQHIEDPPNLQPPLNGSIHLKMGDNFGTDKPEYHGSIKFQRTLSNRINTGLSKNSKRLINNYSFLDKIGDSSDDEVILENQISKDSSFSDTIKSYIQKFLQKAETKVGLGSAVMIQELLEPAYTFGKLAQKESKEGDKTPDETILISDNKVEEDCTDCILMESSQNTNSKLTDKEIHRENICPGKLSQTSVIEIIDEPKEITETKKEHSDKTLDETILTGDNKVEVNCTDCILMASSQNRSSNFTEKEIDSKNRCPEQSQTNFIEVIDQPTEIKDRGLTVMPNFKVMYDGDGEKDSTDFSRLFRSLSTSGDNDDLNHVNNKNEGSCTLVINDEKHSGNLSTAELQKNHYSKSVLRIKLNQLQNADIESLQQSTNADQNLKPIYRNINNKGSSLNSNIEEDYNYNTSTIHLQENSHALISVKQQEFESTNALFPKQCTLQDDLLFKPQIIRNIEECSNGGHMYRMLVSEKNKPKSDTHDQIPQEHFYQNSKLVNSTLHQSIVPFDCRNINQDTVAIHSNSDKFTTVNDTRYTANENRALEKKETSAPNSLPYCPAKEINFERMSEEDFLPDLNLLPNKEFKESENSKVMCTQKYSYVTTEIDIWTKNNSDDNCTLKVIKKLEVNVAAIMAEDTNRKRYFTSDMPVDRRAKPNEMKTKKMELEKEAIMSEATNTICNFSSDKKDKAILPLDRRATTIEITTDKKELEEECPNEYVDKDEYKTNKASIGIENNLKHNNEITDIHHEKHTYEKGKSAVDSLLKKYANILKENAEQKNIRTFQKHSPEHKTNSQKVKPKRPFRISDIHKIDATLPDTLIDMTMTPKTTTPPNPDEGRNRVLNHPLDQQSSKEPDFQYSRPIMDMKNQDPNLNYSKPIVVRDPEICFDIDQSLLNPKNLLQQCYTNIDQDEIIPPPAQFCDATVYSPRNETNYYFDQTPTLMLHDGVENYCDADEFDTQSYLEAAETSYLDSNDFEHSESTPSKDIETWAFSTEEEPCNSQSSAIVRASDKFMPANKFNIGYNRRERLARYQLNTKAKFKVSKNK